ncbi:glycosyltransferase family 4 protein [Paenibacillus lactis]|uniref:glycosyltransferase family 4 protein n=1 Tax=Paenibacillus lactis TaxID=228574 RepID=UPI00203E7084|nr:glycosyltransferase family 4 protein [Paenibacillus lactis]MCM3493468.1 glycosyltransferase family 4 protein [Paenibacillus lactis]
MIDNIRDKHIQKRLQRLPFAYGQILQERKTLRNSKSHIVYVLNHVGVCGGVKIILEQANRLVEKGWHVTLVSHAAPPTWFKSLADYIRVPLTIDLDSCIPTCDVIIATAWDHIQICIDTGIAPVIYFEQGDKHLFEPQTLSSELYETIKRQISLPAKIMTVSMNAKKALAENYNRLDAEIINNAIDNELFNNLTNQRQISEDRYILMMGSDQIAFKDIDTIFTAYKIIRDKYKDIYLYWITPIQPKEENIHKADRIFINPTQSEIAHLFKGALMFISASRYESFSLPVLEAMSTGCPVISTPNAGVLEYSIDNVNIIHTPFGDGEKMAYHIERLLNDPVLRENIRSNAEVTSKRYHWKDVMTRLIDVISAVSKHEPCHNISLDDWEIFIHERCFLSSEDYGKFIKCICSTSANEIYVPVKRILIDEHKSCLWILAAKRKEGVKTYSQSILTYVNNNDGIHLGLELVRIGEYQKAYDGFKSEYLSSELLDKSLHIKWMIICLIELNRDQEALELIHLGIRQYPDYTDLYYLYVLFLSLSGYSKSVDDILPIIQILGDACGYPEFFTNICTLTSERIGSLTKVNEGDYHGNHNEV